MFKTHKNRFYISVITKTPDASFDDIRAMVIEMENLGLFTIERLKVEDCPIPDSKVIVLYGQLQDKME